MTQSSSLRVVIVERDQCYYVQLVASEGVSSESPPFETLSEAKAMAGVLLSELNRG